MLKIFKLVKFKEVKIHVVGPTSRNPIDHSVIWSCLFLIT